jgi:hypothetical protein
LVLTHVSSRYAGGELRDEARAVFADTEAARDFDTIEVPFPERGRASLVRWSERLARERAERPLDERPAAEGPAAEGPAADEPDSEPAEQPSEPVASP